MKSVSTITEAAELVDIKLTLLKLCVETEKLKPSIQGKSLDETFYYVNEMIFGV